MQRNINITVITNKKHHGQMQEVPADPSADVMVEYCGLFVLLWKGRAFHKL